MKNDFAVMFTVDDVSVTVLYDGCRNELNNIKEAIQSTDDDSELNIVNVNKETYEKCKNNMSELRELLISKLDAKG